MGWLKAIFGAVLPSWGIYAILAAAFAGWGGYCAYLMADYKDGVYAAKESQRVALAVVAQYKTDAQIATWKKLVEATNDRAKAQDAVRLAQLDAARKLLDAVPKARASRRIVPPSASSSVSDKRICFPDRDALDREISAGITGAFGRYAPKRIASAEEGQHAVDVAVLCKGYTKGLNQ